jgi:signal recognition particle GTPase
MKAVIQINSLKALEKLIGGNSEKEIAVRNNVVQDFSRKYLKAVAHELCGKFNDDYLLSIENDIRGELYEWHFDGNGKRVYTGLNKKNIPSKNTIEETKRIVNDKIDSVVNETIENKLKNIDEYIEKHIQRKIEGIFSESDLQKIISEKQQAKIEVDNYFAELEKNMDTRISEMVAEKVRNILTRYKNEKNLTSEEVLKYFPELTTKMNKVSK